MQSRHRYRWEIGSAPTDFMMGLRLHVTILVAKASLAMPLCAVAQTSEIRVQASLSRSEIERVLEEDNLNLGVRHPNTVCEAMESIRQGRAPDDFWISYQRHV
jgi:hypothetical protein